MVLIGLVGFSLHDLNTGCLLGVLIVQDTRHDRKRPYGQVACSYRRGQRGRLCAEISPERATLPATVPELAPGPAGDSLGQVRSTGMNHVPGIIVMFFYALRYVLFDAVHLYRFQEMAIGQLRQALLRPVYAGKLFHVIIPRREVFIPDGPVDRPAVF